MQYQNPIITGFHPDPSICRVKDKFYLVTSSFNYFPGVPLFESQDLVNWQQIGHVLTRPSQLNLTGSNMSGGIYAPTIRYHHGRFYMVTTNVDHGGNFYVWTDNIYGEWSEPIWVEQGGIDPSLYFEGDKAYFMSNGDDDEGNSGITQCEIDITNGKKLSASHCLWQGTGGRYLEGPHLYHINHHYYLVASEGGTEYGHMVVYARSKNLGGPYHSYSRNPVLTNRNLGGYQLQGCGHADLVDDGHGHWWFVHLAFRQLDRYIQHHTLGREVCLTPVTFDQQDWFTAGQESTARLTVETDRLSQIKQEKKVDRTFANTRLGTQWVYLRQPHLKNYRTQKNIVSLQSTPVTLDQGTDSPSLLLIRQQQLFAEIGVTVTIENHEAGLTLFMSEQLHYEVLIRRQDAHFELLRRLRIGDVAQEDHVAALPNTDSLTAKLKVIATNLTYHFYAEIAGKDYDLGSAQTKYLSSEVGNNFTGVMIGIYAQNNFSRPNAWASFSNFHIHYPEDQKV